MGNSWQTVKSQVLTVETTMTNSMGIFCLLWGAPLVLRDPPFLILCIHSFAFSNLYFLKAILMLQASLEFSPLPLFPSQLLPTPYKNFPY